MLVRKIQCTPLMHGAPDSERDKKKQTNKQKNKHYIFAPTDGGHRAIFPKLCMVIELVVPIKNEPLIFLIQPIVFFYRVHGKIWPNLLTRGFSAITP